MADERIDIVVDDRVNPNITKKITDIGLAAAGSNSSVRMLKAELASLNASGVTALNRALNDNARATVAQAAATDKSAAAYLKSELALNRATAAEARARVEQARLATETAKAELAASKLALAKDKEAASIAKVTVAAETEAQAQARLSTMVEASLARQKAAYAPSAGSGALGGAAAGSKSLAAAQTALMAGGAGLGAGVKEATASIEALEAVAVGRFGKIKAAALNAYDGIRDASATFATRFKGFFGNGGVATIEKEAVALGTVGKSAHVNSTALRELFVLAREGGRGDFTRMAGSVSILAGSLGLLESVLLPVAIAVGTVAGALKLFQVSFASEAKPQLDAYANSLGLTSKEMRKLGNETVGAEGKLKEFDSVTITFGDTFHGFIATVKEGFSGLSPAISKTADFLKVILGGALSFVRLVFVGFYGLVIGGLTTIGQALLAIKTGFSDPIQGAKDFGNAILNTGKNVNDAIGEADNTLKAFGERMKANTLKAAKDRIAEEAKAIINNRNPKADHTAENRAAALAKVNRELDSEISLMGKVGPEREASAKFDEINNQLLNKKIKLSADETASIKAKIKTIQDLKPVQQEMDRIYDDVTGPMTTYNATLDAANNLLNQGKISLKDYTAQVHLAGQALDDATNPLAAMNRDLENQLALTDKYGKALDRAQFLQQAADAYRAKGKSIYQDNGATDANGEITVGGQRTLRPEVAAAADKNDQLKAAQYTHDQLADLMSDDTGNQMFIQNYKNMLDEIDRLRNQNLVSEAQSFKYRGDLAEKYVHARLASEENVLSQLTSLQNSNVKELAAIGKAAAITQATIDGYAAVQKALASAPPPFNFVLAAVVGAAAAANVAKIAGFETGGYTGNGGRSEVAGVVHGKEFVVNATATAQYRGMLEQMNRGGNVRGYADGGYVQPSAMPVRPAPANVGNSSVNVQGGDANVKVVNVTDPSEIPSAMDSAEGERVILNVISRNQNKVKRIVGA